MLILAIFFHWISRYDLVVIAGLGGLSFLSPTLNTWISSLFAKVSFVRSSASVADLSGLFLLLSALMNSCAVRANTSDSYTDR